MGSAKSGYIPPRKMRIVRDTREKAGKGWNFKASSNCYGQNIEKLDVGDYTVYGMEKILMIERKTIGDLWNTLGGKSNYERFLREMDRARNHKFKYLIIEGTVADINRGYRYSKVSANNIHAKLISLQTKHNLHVIFAGRMDIARAYVRRLMYKLYVYYKDGIV